MPLVKSKTKKAFSKNVKKEVKSGKPVKQAVAVAYSVKDKAADKKTLAAKKSTKTTPSFFQKKFEQARRKVFNLPKDY